MNYEAKQLSLPQSWAGTETSSNQTERGGGGDCVGERENTKKHGEHAESKDRERMNLEKCQVDTNPLNSDLEIANLNPDVPTLWCCSSENHPQIA